MRISLGLALKAFFTVFTILVVGTANCFASSLTQKAIDLHKRGSYRQAVSLFDQEIAANPKNVNAVYYAADCYYRMGDIAKAVILYNALIRKFPGTVPAQYARRALLGISRSYSNGHEPFEQSTRRANDSIPDSVSIPFAKENTGHLVVSCLLNGKPQKMIFDTGASVCVATKEQLLKLGIQVPEGGPQSYATGVSGTVKTKLMPIEIQLGALKKRVVLSVMDQLPTLPLLGESFFGGYQFVIDNSSGNIQFFKPGSQSSAIPNDTIDIPFVRKGQELEVSARINDVDVKLFFDTGAQSTVLPSSVILRTVASKWAFKGYGTSSGVGGQGVCKAYNVSSFSVGPIKKYNFQVITVDRLPIPCGLLGQDFFGHKKFSIDNRRNMIRFWR